MKVTGFQKDPISTSQGLYNLAVKNGLQNRADKILSSKGEEVKKIFSGGFVSDIFDVLNSLQYGVVGMLKGKGFQEGIRTRQSFSDKDALGDNGIPGVIGGIALDIAVDPLTYIAPWTIAKKIPGLTAGISKLGGAIFGKEVTKAIPTTGKVITDIQKARTFKTIEGGSKVGRILADKLKYAFGVDPIFKNTIEKSQANIIRGGMNIKELVKGVIDIPKDKQALLLTRDTTGRFKRTDLKKLKGLLNAKEYKQVENSWNKLDDLGRQAVDVGLLSKEKFEENLGEYIKNSYEKYELAKSKGLFGFIKQKVTGIKARKELTPEQLKTLGQIDNPSYLLFKSMIDLNNDIENTKLFNAVSKRFGADSKVFKSTIEAEQAGFKKLPSGKSWGALADQYIPSHIHNYLTEINRTKGDAERLMNRIVGEFKFNKVVLSPATHARNIISNQILNWWKLGMNPLDPRTILSQRTAVMEMAKGGKWIEEAKTAGYGLDTFFSNELKDLLLEGKGKLSNKIAGIRNKLGGIYQGEENFAKLSAFIFNRQYKNMGIEDAWKTAESATFNYAQVTPFIRRLRESIFGYPFITFGLKAAPTAVETALKTPRRISVIGKIKNAIEQMADIEETQKERANEPAWVKDGFYIKLPMKDGKGRSAYFDLTYIIPFGDLISGQMFERAVSRETGLPEAIPTAILKKSPALNLIREISRNQDFYGDKIWQESDTQDKQLGDLFRHVIKTMSPPAVSDQLPGGYIQAGDKAGERRQKGVLGALNTEENIKQQRTLMQELLRNIGLKIQPIDVDLQETYMELEKRKALETLLGEAGIISTFEKTYIPK